MDGNATYQASGITFESPITRAQLSCAPLLCSGGGKYAPIHRARCSCIYDGYCEMAERNAKERSHQRKVDDQPLPKEITASRSTGGKNTSDNTPTLSPESGLLHRKTKTQAVNRT